MRFVDTNVLLYAISTDAGERDKAARARELLSARDLALSAQVLQELYVQATRQSRADALTHDQAAALVTAYGRFPVQSTTLELVHAAMAASHRHGLSYWDAAIIEAARLSGCAEVLSEDLSSSQDYDGVTVTNPFADVAQP